MSFYPSFKFYKLLRFIVFKEFASIIVSLVGNLVFLLLFGISSLRVFNFTKTKGVAVLFIECVSYAHIYYATSADAAMYVPWATTIVNGEALTSNSRAIAQNQTSTSIISCDMMSMSFSKILYSCIILLNFTRFIDEHIKLGWIAASRSNPDKVRANDLPWSDWIIATEQ